MNEFRFAEPAWIHLLWLVAAIAGGLVFLEFYGRSVLERFVSQSMQPRLVRRSTLVRRMAALGTITLAMLALVFALMRPQWGMTVQRAVRVDSQIMICLDVSRSMLAEDVAPNRLDRAKIELDSLLGLMAEGQQVGLIAFAGKAAVLCPMTTDFGFLRLILNEAAPESVGRGGTQIGDAIRKAVEGFRESGDIHRLILLVTDGEDHDSFPLEAAKEAKEKGVKIVSVGFGDEAGSKIEITNPQTGGRSFVEDREGEDVISRLDGETLRDIALQTDGAYIPAGTGALDLESIYRTHIASMLRGSTEDQQHIVRNEAYQWLVISALVLLFIGLILAAPFNLHSRAWLAPDAAAVTTSSRAAVWWLGFALAASAGTLHAQPSPTAPQASPQPAAVPAQTALEEQVLASDRPVSDEPAVEQKEVPASEEEGLTPRAAYNRGVPYVQSDPQQAERYLNLARRDAGSDGELRYRALYNLGWVEVARADGLLKNDPAQALQHLQQAANRFREAVRVRPDSSESRHNLEIVSQRILELTDALAKKDPRDLASRLEELIEQLRGHQTELQVIVQQAGDEVDKTLADTYRQEFRRLGVTQRQILADYQRLADDARKELDALNQKPDDQKSPDERLQAGQYGNVLRFLDSGLQRLNQSRSLTRRLQGNRAFRRWSAGLTDTKRARDQLRNPVELLGYLIADATDMANMTRGLAAGNASLSPQEQQVPTPTWLTRDYLQELQASTLDRTTELEQMLSSATATPEPSQTQPSASPQPATPDPRTQQLLDNIQRAIPFIQQAGTLFEQSSQELSAGSLDVAHKKQLEAIVELS
ncbi:MAG: vWA domain-containing protein, partial [Pirellulaceae bacterium]